jgi:hypothetical protein
MSLLLKALERVAAKPSITSTLSPTTAEPFVQHDECSRPLANAVTTGLDSISELAVLAIDALPPVATATPGVARCMCEVRQLAAKILTTFPKGAALGVAFVNLPGSSDAARFLSLLAQAIAATASGEVLQLSDVSELASERSWKSWKQRFRYVVVQSDGKPNEAKFLAGADGVYLVVTLGKTRRRSVQDCIRRFQAAGVPIRGSILIGRSLCTA